MGWWRIDPESGSPLKGDNSPCYRLPDLVLLNAIPNRDGEAGAYYLGDGPSDIVSTMPSELAGIDGTPTAWSADQIRDVFLHARVPHEVTAEAAQALRMAVRAFWGDIDGCYEDDWDRPALPPERRWICEELVDRLVG